MRFDDTNPSKEKDEFVENIMKDIADLGLRYERLTYTSDYFPQVCACSRSMAATLPGSRAATRSTGHAVFSQLGPPRA